MRKCEPPKSVPAMREVETIAIDLFDRARNREVPIRAYLPPTSGALPLVVFSHGLGESRDAYEYLGRHWAANGIVAIHITHRGSDADYRRDHGLIALHRATREPQTWINRPLDVTYILDLLERRDPTVAAISARVDTTKVAIAGHSAGAFTALVMAGAVVKGSKSIRDERVKAAIAISLPRLEQIFLEHAYDDVTIPVLHLTGTRDRSIFYWTFPKHRRDPFERSPGPNQYLVTIRKATHWTFSNPDRADRPCEQRMHALVQQATTKFLDAHLRNDAAARERLLKTLPSLDDGAAKVEQK